MQCKRIVAAKCWLQPTVNKDVANTIFSGADAAPKEEGPDLAARWRLRLQQVLGLGIDLKLGIFFENS